MKNLLTKNTLAHRAVGLCVLMSIAFSLLPLSANAQTTEPPSRQLRMPEKTTIAELPRLALVIGNGKYEKVTPLKNPAFDASDMTVALTSLGFKVISGIDQNKKQMEVLIREFGDELYKNKGIGLFFYAGHGVQSNGKNYLVPIDADIPREDEISDSAVDINRILAKFDTAKSVLNIIILDACRNNPFAKDWSEFRSVNSDEGLAKINAPKGTMMFYATEPGKTASDGSGRNGLFTEALLENIKKPLELDGLYKAVARTVEVKSKQTQRPYREGTVTSDFYFAELPVSSSILSSPILKAPDEAEPEIKEKDAATLEREFWNLVKNSKKPSDFKEFLAQHPNGTYSGKAKKLLEQVAWDSISKTTDKAKIQNYLDEFPNSANVPLAKFVLGKLESSDNAEPEKTEPAAAETAKVEKEEIAEPPVKKVIVPKVEAPKAAARTVKSKTKALPADSGKPAPRKNDVGMEFVYLPAGNFMMGSSEANINESYTLGRKDYKETERSWFDNEKTQHRVTFNDGFWIGKTEVTQAQWTAVMGENPSNNKGCDDCPVERVNWDDAKKFVEELNKKNDGFVYRLPSEAEWEYAARGGKPGVLAGRMDDMAWYNPNSDNKTHPVGTQQPNSFGLYDMHGNVAEWCEDVYTASYDESPLDGTANTTVGDPVVRILRGGNFTDFPTYLRLPRRVPRSVKLPRAIVNGLRVVATVK